MPRRLWTTTGAVLAVIITAVPAWAEKAANADDGPLPQMRPEFYAGELFWLAIAFAALYLLMRRLALPRIAAVQDARAAQRRTDLEAAAHANAAAQTVIAAYEKSLAEARVQAQAQLGRIVGAAQQEAAQATARRQQELDVRMSSAMAQINTQLQQALTHVQDTAVTATTAIVHRLVGQDADVAAAVARAVVRISRQTHDAT